MERSPLMDRLTAIRGTIRRRLIAYGVCAVSAGGVVGFLTIVMLDWLLWFPPPVRVAVAGLYLAGFVVALVHWIIRPLRVRLGIAEVAARLEQRFGVLADRLTSTVDFLEYGAAGSAPMMSRVVAGTEALSADVPLESAVASRPLWRQAALLAAAGGVLAAVVGLAPAWASTGFYRYVYPLGALEWPRNVQIVPRTGDLTVALGEPAVVRMEVRRGLHRNLRSVVNLREPGSPTTSLAMRGSGDGEFHATIDAVTRDLTYWFEAGDDSTEDRPFWIRVIRRPEVTEGLATVRPPPYAAGRPVRVFDLGDGPVPAPLGGSVLITVQASKAIPADRTGRDVGLQILGGERIPLRPDPRKARTLTAELPITADVRFRIKLTDAHGFENRGTTTYTVEVVSDRPPVVTLLEPRAVIESTPRGSVELLIRAEDDFGISRLDLEMEFAGGAGVQRIALTDRLEVAETEQMVEAVARYTWDLTPLSMAPGDVLVYAAVARDNHRRGDQRGQVGRSSPQRIKIISEVEFDIRLRSDLALLEARVRELALAEGELLDRTRALQQTGGAPDPLTAEEKDAAASLGGRQARLVRGARDLAARFEKLAARMARNRIDEAGAGRPGDEAYHPAALAKGLQQVATGAMTAASNALDEARASSSARDQQARLAGATSGEEAAVDALHMLLRRMSEWGSFRDLLTKTKDLLERQAALRANTAGAGRTTLGKPVDALTETQVRRLKGTARRQRQFGADVERHLARMKQLAASAQSKDPSAAEAVTAALRAARAMDIRRRLREAEEAIDTNRTAAATIAQRQVGEALQRMVYALNERESRRLHQLRKRLERARDQVADLFEQQRMVRTATFQAGRVASDATVYRTLARDQHRLRRNTGSVAQELASTERTAAMARLVRRAAEPMREAEVSLREEKSEPALRLQDEAMALLTQALERLDSAVAEAGAAAMRRTLADIREVLESVLAAEREVSEGIETLLSARNPRGRLDRHGARTASRLARRQADIRRQVRLQQASLQRAAVFEWALERVDGWMEEIRLRLAARRVDEELADLAARIIRKIETLIAAIRETERLPMDTQFVESEGGGGGGQQGQGSRSAVPAVSELLVLKSMQDDINERTREWHEAFDGDTANESQLREMRTLGEDQAEVRRLTELVTRHASEP